MIIGITGRIKCGKETAVKFFLENGFNHLVFSDAIKEEMEKRGILIDRSGLQDIGNELRNKYGAGIWAKRLLEKVEEGKNYILDGIRNPGEIEELRKRNDFVLIGIFSTQKERFERMIDKADVRDPKTWEDFLVVDNRDFGEDDKNGQQVGKCMDIVDYMILNDSSIENFRINVENIWERILGAIKNEL
jgi:dephospho-CoA kinase